MLIDACAYLGHYPFRKTENQTAPELIALMDDYGIEKALVSSLPAVYYRDVMDGNRELFDEIAPCADRLIPVATGNPRYPCALDDLAECVRRGCRAVRLYPKQHGYQLTDPCAVEYLRRAAELHIPVAFPLCLEDLRGRHHLDIMYPLSADEIADAARLAPETDFILHNHNNYSYAAVLSERCPNRVGGFYYDIGRTDCLYVDGLQRLIATAGLDHVLFGTSMPLQYIDVQLVKLHYLPDRANLTDAQMELLTSGNAKRLFRL